MTIRSTTKTELSSDTNRRSNKDETVVTYADAKLAPNGGAGIGAPAELGHHLPVAQLAPMNDQYDYYSYPTAANYCAIVSPATETSHSPSSGEVVANNFSKETTKAIGWIPQPLPDGQPQEHPQSYSFNSSSMPSFPCPNFAKMKKRRVRAQFLAGTAGAVVGLVFLGPLGALVCGFAGNKLVKGVAKTRENRIKAKYQRELAAAQVAASCPVPAYAAEVA